MPVASDLPGSWDALAVSRFLTERGFGDGPFEVTTLNGGRWNDVVKIPDGNGEFVLKRYRTVMPDSLFPNLPDAEAAALRRLSGLGVGAEPIAYWPDAMVLIYDFVPGGPGECSIEDVAALFIRKERPLARAFAPCRPTPGRSQPKATTSSGGAVPVISLPRCTAPGRPPRPFPARTACRSFTPG
jgi:hypothetical protein